MSEKYYDYVEEPVRLPRPINKHYKVGQLIDITRKDVDGFVKRMSVRIVGVYEHFVRVEIPTRLTPYYECFLYTDLR